MFDFVVMLPCIHGNLSTVHSWCSTLKLTKWWECVYTLCIIWLSARSNTQQTEILCICFVLHTHTCIHTCTYKCTYTPTTHAHNTHIHMQHTYNVHTRTQHTLLGWLPCLDCSDASLEDLCRRMDDPEWNQCWGVSTACCVLVCIKRSSCFHAACCTLVCIKRSSCGLLRLGVVKRSSCLHIDWYSLKGTHVACCTLVCIKRNTCS